MNPSSRLARSDPQGPKAFRDPLVLLVLWVPQARKGQPAPLALRVLSARWVLRALWVPSVLLAPRDRKVRSEAQDPRALKVPSATTARA